MALYLASGCDPIEVFDRQLAPLPATSAPPAVDWPKVRADWSRATQLGGSHQAILERVGALALKIAGSGIEERRKIVAAQLPVQSWPQKPVAMVAVNAETGERRAFDRAAGIDLVDAVIATTAFFGWPPAFFEGHHYIDGGFYSGNNADLAAGFDEVLILALRQPAASMSITTLDQAVDILRSAGSTVEVIHPDKASTNAIGSGSPSNPAIRAPVAKAGRAQGQRLARSRSDFRKNEL